MGPLVSEVLVVSPTKERKEESSNPVRERDTLSLTVLPSPLTSVTCLTIRPLKRILPNILASLVCLISELFATMLPEDLRVMPTLSSAIVKALRTPLLLTEQYFIFVNLTLLFQEFGSRKLLVDVASTKDSRGGGDREEDRSRWGPRDGAGSASGFGRRENREPFDGRGERSDGRYDASGPNNWRSQGRPVTSAPAPSGPPKLSLQPRSQPAEEIGGPIKRAGEDPFGGASSNADKLKKQAEV